MIKFLFFTLILCFIYNSSSRAETISQLNLNSSKLSSKENLKIKKTFGHNMTPNTYTLSQGDCVAGFYISSCGLTNNFMVGTSPWLYLNYNSQTLAARYAFNLNSHQRLGLQSTYISSYELPNVENAYFMESIRSHLTLTTFETSLITTHISLTYEFFFEETRAHSYRRNPFNDQPYQFSLTHLTEFNISDRYSIQGEWGMHGLNYVYPQIYTGFSFIFKTKNSAFQLGASMNGAPRSYFSSEKIDTQFDYLDNRGTTKSGIDGKYLAQRDFAIHPEIQWQYFF